MRVACKACGEPTVTVARCGYGRTGTGPLCSSCLAERKRERRSLAIRDEPQR